MDDSLRAILSHKAAVDEYLLTYLKEKKKELVQINDLGGEVIDRLSPFVISGKTTRGSLTVYIYSLFQSTFSPEIYKAAAALELYHSAFLIHDDIMDKDSTRRGSKSMWEQYRATSGNTHIGISQAINAGDLCFMMAQELLADMGLLSMVSIEMQAVVAAQMQDVMSGKGKALSKAEVLSLYRYKTARYTFSLSMSVGATVAGASKEQVAGLVRLGESMGLLFQIRDDELSINGDSTVTGKPTGSDAKNAKQTLATFLNSEEMNDLKGSLLEHSDNEISKLPISDAHKKELAALARFCITRDK